MTNKDQKYNNKSIRSHLILLIPIIMWSSNIIFARALSSSYNPIGFAFWRWFLACILLLPFSLPYIKKDIKTAVSNYKLIILMSFLGITCFNTLLYISLKDTTAVNAALIQTTFPVMIIITNRLINKRKPKVKNIASILLCITGSLIIISKGTLISITRLEFSSADIIILLGVFLYAIYSVLLEKKPKINNISFLFIIFLIGLINLIPFYIHEIYKVGLFKISPSIILGLLYLAVFPSILAFYFWNMAVQEVGPSVASVSINFMPFITSIMAIIILGERLYYFHYIGGFLTLSGIILLSILQR